MPMSDSDYIQRHIQSLGEARAAAQELGRLADPTYNGSRRHYRLLKEAVEMLIGSSRQLGTLRGDARWVRLTTFYDRVRVKLQPAFMGERWKWFGGLTEVFELGQRHIDELTTRRTGVPSGTPILPSRAGEWLKIPDYHPVLDRPASRLLH